MEKSDKLFICPEYLRCAGKGGPDKSCKHYLPHRHSSHCDDECNMLVGETNPGKCRLVTEEDLVIIKMCGWEWEDVWTRQDLLNVRLMR